MKIKEKLKNFNFGKISLNVFVAFGVLFLFGMLFSFMNILPYWINLKVLFVLFIAGGVWFLVEKIKKIPEEERKKNPLIYVCQYSFLLGLIVIAVNQFLQRQIIIDWMFEISVLTIAFGFLVFYAHRNRVEKEIEDEKVKEDEKEKKRKEEFSEKFPRINKIPVFRSIVKWMYKEGWGYSVALIGIVVVGAYFILYKLGNYSFQVDEIFHALVAQNMLKYPFTLAEGYSYLRGNLVSSLAFLFGKIFPFFSKEFSYRLPIALFGVLNIILIYFLAKRIIKNKLISLIISAFIAFDLFFIIFARYLRFYTPAITIILAGFIILAKKSFDKKYILVLFFISLVCSFILNEFFIFIATALFLIYLNSLGKKIINYKILLLGFFLLLAGGLYLYTASLSNANFLTNILNYNLNTDLVKVHFKWILNSYPLLIFSFIPIILLSFSKKTLIQKISLFTLIIYIIFFFFIDMTNYNFTIRIFLFILPINIILLFYSLKVSLSNKKILNLVLILLILFPLMMASFNSIPRDNGDSFGENKLLYEKQSIILDNSGPLMFVKNLIEDSRKDYLIIYSGLNDLYFKYYLQDNPDYLVRWKGSSKNDLSMIGNDLIYDLNLLKSTIFESEKDVIVIAQGSINIIENKFYLNLFGYSPTEADPEIYSFLEKEGKKIYLSEDGYSSVYFFQK